MNIRFKLAVFFAAGICASVLYYLKFQENIRNVGLLNFIGIPTIMAVAICHGIAFLIRALLVRRHRRSMGIDPGYPLWAHDVSMTDKPLFAGIEKSYRKVAALYFLVTVMLAGVALGLFYRIKDIPGEAMEPYLMIYWTALASFVLAMITYFFAIHFLLMSFLLEYASRVKDLFVTLFSFILAFLSIASLF